MIILLDSEILNEKTHLCIISLLDTIYNFQILPNHNLLWFWAKRLKNNNTLISYFTNI